MKKLLTIFLGIALVLPLYSQEAEGEAYDDGNENETTANEENTPEEHPYLADEESPEKEPPPKSEPEKKKGIDFARQNFELGLGLGVGFDNGLAGLSDVFQKNIVIDLSKIAQGIPNNGTGLNIDLSVDLFMNVKNIRIGKGLWDFGFIVDVDGGINLNIPKSMFTLISDGNAGQHDTSGKITASGGIFTEIGLKGSAKYTVAGRTLRIGVKPAIYTPAVYIPSSSGISYHLYSEKETEDGLKEGLFLDTEGEINIYTPTSFENIDPVSFIIGPSGFDLSLEGEYALFPFLDVGASFTNIPFAAATLTNQMNVGMKPFSLALVGEDLISGKELETPDLDFGDPVYTSNVKKDVHRPLRFDVYARYKPFKSEFLVLRPNIGFTANVNKDDVKGYFNAGLEAQLNLANLLIVSLSSGCQEEIWKQRIGLALNLRAFELDLEATFRDQTFAGCFLGRGFQVNLGLCFGW